MRSMKNIFMVNALWPVRRRVANTAPRVLK
jgi:hypothetical protein